MSRLLTLLACSAFALPALADDRHALLIAAPGPVGRKHAEADIAALAAALPRAGYPASNIVVLSGKAATAASILREVQALARRTRAGDTVLVAFCGAGITKSKETVLVPADGNLADATTLLPLSDLYKELSKSRAVPLLLLDACRPGRPCRPHDVEVPEGLAVFVANAAGEYGQEVDAGKQGLFFAAVVRAFKADRVLSLRRFQAFVEEEVPKQAKASGLKEQSPEMLGKAKGTRIIVWADGAGRPADRHKGLLPEVVKGLLAAEKEADELGKLDRIDFHKAAYTFAYSSGGFNLSSTAAKDFAQKMTDLPEARRGAALATIKRSYAYAYGSSGLNLSSTAARKVAEDFGSLPDGLVRSAIHQQAHHYAYNSSGLNLSNSAARTFADDLLTHKEPLKALSLHMKAYKYAYSSDGLNMSSSAARAFADKEAGLVPKK